MKQSVTINGVSLTRAQVEQALVDLNTPDIGPGDLIKVHGVKRLVIGGANDAAFRVAYPALFKYDPNDGSCIHCISLDGKHSFYVKVSACALLKKGPIA